MNQNIPQQPSNSDVKIISLKNILSGIASFIFSIVAYYMTFYSMMENVANSYTSDELDYAAYLYGDVFGYQLIYEAVDKMSSIILITRIIAFLAIFLAIFVSCTTKKRSNKSLSFIIIFISIGVILGSFLFSMLLASEL